MARAGARDPLRLAILLVSIAGLIVLGIKTAGGTDGASATQRAAARDRRPGKVVAIAARRALPLGVRRQIAGPATPGVATVRTSRATYLLGGTRRTAKGARVPVASVLRATGHGRAERVAKLPVAVTGASGAAVGDKIFALGGRLSGGRASDLIQEYDVATERSVIAAKLPAPVMDTAALTLDGFVYLVGGLVDGSPTRAIVRFDPLRGTAVVAGGLPVPASGGIPAASRRHRGYLVRAAVPGAAPLNFEITVGKHGRH
ncbi:MAG TPA: hypothetical protein VLB79_08035 [Solirubrobacterales bacterium]|nr:hypothetical protein [Solirubrobacterales bacterium]